MAVEDESWGTLEELLLACAVHRFGTKSWDSVSGEIKKRSSMRNLLTPNNCERKYHDLKRRFTAINNDDDDDVRVDDDEHNSIPWLDELRKLRVAELKEDVERRDVSIESLQLKVKRLQDEREQSLRESTDKPDLEKGEAEEKGRGEEAEKLTPESVSGKSDSGEDSDPVEPSFNESNSTDPKEENMETGTEDPDQKQPPVDIPVTGKLDPKPGGEVSCNGSSDTIAKESAVSPVRKSSKVDPKRETGESPELWESVAESKDGGGGEEGAKESSDVQSSASLSMRKGREKAVSGNSSGEEPENEEGQSPAIKRNVVKSQPLIDFLEIIRSHRFGSTFERRLESQDTPKYKNIIRQHMDIETIRTRLQEGWYSNSTTKFFRDFLLLVNNAIIFFPTKSIESTAAISLRQIVSKHLSHLPPPPLPPPPLPQPAKPDSEHTNLFPAKPKHSSPIIACRKRSSIAAKALASSNTAKTPPPPPPPPGPPQPSSDLEWKQQRSSKQVEELRVTKKRTRDRGARIVSKPVKTKSPESNANTNTNTNGNAKPSPSSNQNLISEAKTLSNNEKKRSAAIFLNRMKRSSFSSNGSLLESLKSSGMSSDKGGGSGGIGGAGGGGGGGGSAEKRSGGGGSVEKRSGGGGGGSAEKRSGGGGGSGEKRSGGGGGKSDGKKDNRNPGGKQVKEQGSPAKRSVGRPPKRAALSLPPAVPVKRSRDSGGDMEGAGSRQPKKRAKK